MNKKERFHKAKEYAKRVSVLNDRCDAYCCSALPETGHGFFKTAGQTPSEIP